MHPGWELVRVYVDDGGEYEVTHSNAISFTPKVLWEKISLIKLAPSGVRVVGIGWHRTHSIYYVRLYPHEFIALDKEQT
jgi:hypothetical protein